LRGAPACQARFNYPKGVAVDRSGNVFVADCNNHQIRRIDHATGHVSTVAGGVRGVQFHPHGGQSDFVWLSARTPHGAYVR